ncbi:MAG: kinase-like domain-containing protein [Benjaminiella poitrasii]|nr:MAG: kinase-like domain-containing protein [Benjaminiella poitrasii]KAI9470724.1 MAG: kinase-like domain-containing protein [Benjaminiella poitrasii]
MMLPKKSDYYDDLVKRGGSLGHKMDRRLRQLVKKSKDIQAEEDDKSLLLKDMGPHGLVTTLHYQLGNCIGKGQFGSVYRALDLITGETVAIKKLVIEGEDEQEIMKEVTLLKTLSHPNVIRYLGTVQNLHSINIILEYAENGSLLSTLKAFGAFPERLVASFCIKILHGLEYLHENQVVHCDLKAANILTTKTGDVKLSDFGVSLNLKKLNGQKTGHLVSGTPNWMAPEVIELKGASTQSDIWSMGCTLIELVTGKPPYSDMIAMSAMFHIVEDGCPPLPCSISEDMKSFLLACFQKNPVHRPSATDLKRHPWILKNQGGHPTTPSALTKKIKFSSVNVDRSLLLLRQQQEEGGRPFTDDAKKRKDGVRQSERALDGLSILHDKPNHRFAYTTSGKAVQCKVCGELVKSQSICCQLCSLVCHEECKNSAFLCPSQDDDLIFYYSGCFLASSITAQQQEIILVF